MSDWSYMPPQVCLLPLPPQGGIVPQTTSTHFKPPNEGLNIFTPILEEEKEVTSSLHVLFPSLQRLDSSGEEGNRPLTLSSSPVGNTIEDTVQTSLFGNSLGVQGTTATVDDSSQVSIPTLNNCGGTSATLRDSVRLEAGPRNTPALVNNNNNSNNNNSINNRFKCALNARNQLENSNSSNNSNNNDSNSSITSGCLSPTTNSSAPVFPTEPTILANKYIILGPVDSSTSHAVHLKNHEPLHIKAVSSRTAREVCSQQALLGQCEGVRAPLEAVMSGCGKRAWLIFPPHYGDLHSYVRLRRRLREAEAQRLFAQVAATVERCHASGLVLRDLKLRKFVFTDSNRQHVVLESVEDSVVAGESDLLHDKHGCPAYVAPEILSASTYSGRYADMWGLGVILYTMLVGRYPFHNADTSTLFARIRSGKFFIPEWVSSRARHLILSLLRRQPHRRLTAQQVLLHPWLNRCPRDHVGKDPQDHIVPTSELMTQHTLSPGKSRPP